MTNSQRLARNGLIAVVVFAVGVVTVFVFLQWLFS